MDFSFYKGKTVMITGHTGFKGAWLSKVLIDSGAKVIGYAPKEPTVPSLFNLADIGSGMIEINADVRNLPSLMETVDAYKPEIVFHLAAQPIVRTSYKDPIGTYQINVMGTVNVLEASRQSGCVKSIVNVTTDKVYKNNEWEWGYREQDELGGYDPYSNSKACSDLITQSYYKSFFEDSNTAVSIMRAGNVIGGGDFAKDRIIPDCVRAAERGKPIIVRNPMSIRPYQHVLEPIFAYIMVAQKQYENKQKYQGIYNIGPNDRDCITTETLVTKFCKAWGNGATWETGGDNVEVHEANYLKLDCSRIKRVFGWQPKMNITSAIESTVLLSKRLGEGNAAIRKVLKKQIAEYSN